jgi:DNA-binding MarR family transcriptional regulator
MTNTSSLTDDYRPIFQDIARFRGIIFDAKLKPYDMTMSQGFVLAHLWRENGLRQLDLAERMNIATVTTSKLIDRLEARGFVERRADAEDRRSNRVYATEKGIAQVKILTKIVLEVDEIANAGIDADALEQALSVLGHMRENLRSEITQK